MLLIWVPWVVIYLIYSIQLVRYPYEWEPGEGSKILYAQRIIERQPLYKSNTTFPMLGNCYPPLYPALTALLISATNLHIGCGRLISIMAILIMLFLIYKVIRARTNSYIWGIVGAGCFVMPSFVANWYSLARMDALCSCFLLSTVYIMSKREGSLKQTILAAVFAVCALFTKQTAIFVVGMCAVYYLINRKWKDLFVFCITGLILGCVIFFVCNWLSGGWFYKNVFAENIHRLFFLKRYSIFFGILIQNYPWAWICAGGVVGWKLYRRQWDIWLFYFIGGLANALLIGANGSGMNYFITLWSAVALFFAEGLHRVWYTVVNSPHLSKNIYRSSILIIICLLTTTNIVGKSYGFFYRTTLLSYLPSPENYSAMQAIEAIIQTTQEPVFVDRLPSLTVRHDKSDYYLEPALIQELYRAKQWDPHPLIKMIENRHFAVICLFSQSLIPKPIQDAIRKHYLLSDQIEVGTFEIWRKRVVLIYRRPPENFSSR